MGPEADLRKRGGKSWGGHQAASKKISQMKCSNKPTTEKKRLETFVEGGASLKAQNWSVRVALSQAKTFLLQTMFGTSKRSDN